MIRFILSTAILVGAVLASSPLRAAESIPPAADSAPPPVPYPRSLPGPARNAGFRNATLRQPSSVPFCPKTPMVIFDGTRLALFDATRGR